MLHKYESYLCKEVCMSKKTNPKRDRFERLGTYRTNEVLRKLKVLGNCGNRSAYDYTEEDVNKIFTEIERQLKDTRTKFHYPKCKSEFKL